MIEKKYKLITPITKKIIKRLSKNHVLFFHKNYNWSNLGEYVTVGQEENYLNLIIEYLLGVTSERFLVFLDNSLCSYYRIVKSKDWGKCPDKDADYVVEILFKEKEVPKMTEEEAAFLDDIAGRYEIQNNIKEMSKSLKNITDSIRESTVARRELCLAVKQLLSEMETATSDRTSINLLIDLIEKCKKERT